MRNASLVSLALAGAALLFSFGATAAPIHVGLNGAAGQQHWTSPGFGDPSYVTLSAWQRNANQGWDNVWMTNGQDGDGNPGLGVCASAPDTSNVCTNTNETNGIDSIPQQIIDMDISELIHWSGVTITLLSVEHGSLLTGATCSLLDNCTPQLVQLDGTMCSAANADGMVFCNYSKDYLSQLGITDIWIQSQSWTGCGSDTETAGFGTYAAVPNCNGSILLGSGLDFGFIMEQTAVPEPSVFGMFGLGTLLLGLFMAIDRRRRT